MSVAVSGGLGRDAQAATAGSLTVGLSLPAAMDLGDMGRRYAVMFRSASRRSRS